jgi:hypothetical protein
MMNKEDAWRFLNLELVRISEKPRTYDKHFSNFEDIKDLWIKTSTLINKYLSGDELCHRQPYDHLAGGSH